MLDSENKPFEEGYRPEDFRWRVRKVANWLGRTEMMIELDELDGCVSFGDTLRDAKVGLVESLLLWIRKHGEHRLPDRCTGAHIIIIDPPMCEEDFTYINTELTYSM